MVDVSCNLCGRAAPARALWTVPDRHWAPEERFRLVRCPACAFVYLAPRPEPEAMGRYYPSWTYAQVPAGDPEAFQWRARQIERHHARGTILDVGCSNGGFLAFLQRRGWEVYGFDNAPGAIEVARARLGDRVQVTTLDEARYPADRFDVVCLFEVLEHVPDPVGHLREIRRILKPGGIVCLSVPNFSSWECRLFGPWWNGLDAPRHFQQFTPRTLARALALADLRAVELRSVNACRIQADRRRISYCQESLRFFLRDAGCYPRRAIPTPEAPVAAEAVRPAAGWKRVLHGLEAGIFLPFCALSHLADRENTLWACARRPEAA